jgi:hypothetical protein
VDSQASGHAERLLLTVLRLKDFCPRVLTMCAGTDDAASFDSVLRDLLIPFVMESNRVTEQETVAAVAQLRRALAIREWRVRSGAL